MKFIKLSFEQAAQLLKEAVAGVPRETLVKRYGVSKATIWNWMHYKGLDTRWLFHVKFLERQVRGLQADLAKTQLQLKASAAVVKRLEPSPKRRALFASAIQAMHGLKRSRAHAAVGLSCATRKHGVLRVKDEALVQEMRGFLKDNPGVGFKNLFNVLLQDRGCTRNHALVLYRQERMWLKHRSKVLPMPKRISNPRPITDKRDAMWAMDFMWHKLTTTSRFWVLNAVDEYTRECIFSIALRRPGTAPVIAALEFAGGLGRTPAAIRTDNGREFTSERFLAYCHRHSIGTIRIRPHRPNENAFVERFNGTLRREVFNWYKFRSLVQVQSMLDDYCARYNVGRPHKSLGGLSPLQFAHLMARRKAQQSAVGLFPVPKKPDSQRQRAKLRGNETRKTPLRPTTRARSGSRTPT